MYYRHPTSQRERSLEVVRTQIVGFHYTRRASSIRTRVTLWYNIQSPACDYGGLQLNRFGLVTFTSVLMDTFARVPCGMIGALIYPQITTIGGRAGERKDRGGCGKPPPALSPPPVTKTIHTPSE